MRDCRLAPAVPILCATLLVHGCGAESDSIMDELELPTFGSDTGSSGDLEIPPTLDAPVPKETYDVASMRKSASGAMMEARVLPQRLGMRLHTEDNITWLAVGATPDALWPHLVDFWRSYGFEVTDENMLHGRIQTDWRERQLDAAGGVRVRDMFRMRVERAPDAITNVYLANRKGTFNDGQWRVAFSDRETEVEILNDLADYLASKSEVKDADISPIEDTRTTLDVKNLKGAPVLIIGQRYSHVWRRLGVTLDRAGLDVRRTDRSRGIYLVRYRDRETTAPRLLQLHLLSRGGETAVTVHPNRARDPALDYETASEVLQRIVMVYTV